MARALVFGGSGQIGAACADALRGQRFRGNRDFPTGWRGHRGIRSVHQQVRAARRRGSSMPLFGHKAQTLATASSTSTPIDTARSMTRTCCSCLKAFTLCSSSERLAGGARLCVISSIWQTSARPNKLSYMVSKAALQGLVLSAATDLAERGILVNAVLPGALDTPMTRQNLTAEQIDRIAGMTKFDRLASARRRRCSGRLPLLAGQHQHHRAVRRRRSWLPACATCLKSSRPAVGIPCGLPTPRCAMRLRLVTVR